MIYDGNITILGREGIAREKSVTSGVTLDVLKRYGVKAAITDFAILLGGYASIQGHYTSDGKDLKNRVGLQWTKTYDIFNETSGEVSIIDCNGEMIEDVGVSRNVSIRPALINSFICNINEYERPSWLSQSDYDSLNFRRDSFRNLLVDYGEYPQQVVEQSLNVILERNFRCEKLHITGKKYTVDSVDNIDSKVNFIAQELLEYKFDGKKYVRLAARRCSNDLSNGVCFSPRDVFWVEVQPITWLIDEKEKIALALKLLASGIKFCNKPFDWNGKFDLTAVNQFLQTYFIKDIIPSCEHEISLNEKKTDVLNTLEPKEETVKLVSEVFSSNEEILKKRLIDILALINSKKESKDIEMEKKKNINSENGENICNFNLNEVSEEEILRGAIENGMAVFLHGNFLEAKISKVKKIDPTCEVIYLPNASLDSLDGKIVFKPETTKKTKIPFSKTIIDPITLEEKIIHSTRYEDVVVEHERRIDIKPIWLKRLEEKCKKEPDRYHIVFLDGITNVLPSIQEIAFNIALDRKVNGMWKLPENTRIVVAGNDMENTLAENPKAEQLLNKFAHVHINTTVDSLLELTIENKIHPAIYSYIAYKKGELLISECDDKNPIEDLQKWENASKILYATNRPEMLRALVGKDITRDFIEFCSQVVITVEDVINEYYSEEFVKSLSAAEKYATTMGLLHVDEANFEKVREFVYYIGMEFGTQFDALWSYENESRLKMLQEIKLNEMQNGRKRICIMKN